MISSKNECCDNAADSAYPQNTPCDFMPMHCCITSRYKASNCNYQSAYLPTPGFIIRGPRVGNLGSQDCSFHFSAMFGFSLCKLYYSICQPWMNLIIFCQISRRWKRPLKLRSHYSPHHCRRFGIYRFGVNEISLNWLTIRLYGIARLISESLIVHDRRGNHRLLLDHRR